MGDVDISAEAVLARLSRQFGETGDAEDRVYIYRDEHETLLARITALESLNATRNQQNAAAWAEVERLREAQKIAERIVSYIEGEAFMLNNGCLSDMADEYRAALAPQGKQNV